MPRVDPAQLEAEADALLTGEPQDPPTEDTPPAPEPPPAPEDEPEPEEDPGEGEPPADPEPETPPEDDLTGLTLKNAAERIKNAQQRMHTATAEAAELRKKHDSLTRDLEDAQADVRRLQREVDQLKAAPPAPAAPAPTPVAESALKRLVDEYPEMAPVVEEMLGLRTRNEQLAGKVTEMQTQIAETGRKVDTRSNSERIAEHLSAIRKKHPDLDKIKAADDFKGWKTRQPPVVQEALNKGTADDVIWALDLYKAAVGIGKRKGKLGAAVTAAQPDVTTTREPPTGQKRTFTRAQIRAMKPAEYAALEAEIDLAMAEGRIRD